MQDFIVQVLAEILDKRQSWSLLEKLLIIFDLPVSVGFNIFELLRKGVKSILSFSIDFIDLLLEVLN